MTGYTPIVHEGQGWMDGRHWAVAFRCERCGRLHFSLFKSSTATGCNLQCVEEPEGWKTVMHTLLCGDCLESYTSWLREGEDA